MPAVLTAFVQFAFFLAVLEFRLTALCCSAAVAIGTELTSVLYKHDNLGLLNEQPEKWLSVS